MTSFSATNLDIIQRAGGAMQRVTPADTANDRCYRGIVPGALHFQVWELGAGSKVITPAPLTNNFATGILLGNLPAGNIQIVSGFMQTAWRTQVGGIITSGQFSLGTVAASGAVAVLTSTPTWVDLLGIGTIGSIASDTAFNCDLLGTMRDVVYDAGGAPVYLNVAVDPDAANAAGFGLTVGRVCLFYTNQQ